MLDKILHNYAVATAILENPRTRGIILLRQPVDVVQSIVHMGRHLDLNEQNSNVANATQYYVERLGQLTKLARIFGKRAAFVESEMLMSRTDDDARTSCRISSASIRRFERRYRSFSKTGKPGYGDPSEMIHSGEIGRRSQQRPTYSIPNALLAQAVNGPCGMPRRLPAELRSVVAEDWARQTLPPTRGCSSPSKV